MTAETLIERRRAAWDAAFAARSNHLRIHRDARAWHPWGTPARAAADTRGAIRVAGYARP